MGLGPIYHPKADRESDKMVTQPKNRHVETVFIRAGEWVTINHGLGSFEVVVSTYSMVDFSLIGTTMVHTDPDTIELTTSHYTYYEREDGTGELDWSYAQDDVYVRVVVLA